MSNQINWFVDSFYGVLNISGAKTSITKKTKDAGVFSNDVSTDTIHNIKTSTIKVGNAMRRAISKIS